MTDTRVPAAIGGFILGIVVGVFVVSGPAVAAATTYSLPFIIGIVALTFVAGILLGLRGSTEKQQPIRFTGRIFSFPQAPIAIEVALRRMGALVRGEQR